MTSEIYKPRDYPAMIMKIQEGGMEVVINRGREDGLENGQRFLIYSLGDEMIDPESSESLGRLEIVKGKGKVVHLQERIATIMSINDTIKKSVTKSRYSSPPNSNAGQLSFFSLAGSTRDRNSSREEERVHETTETNPFKNAQVGDLAKPI